MGRPAHIRSPAERDLQQRRELARKLGQDEEFVGRIFFASPMHHMGKIGIPDHVLLKPGRLTRDEWEVMKSHTWMGTKILGESKSSYLRMGAEIASITTNAGMAKAIRTASGVRPSTWLIAS